MNFHSEVPERVPMDGKHDDTQGFAHLVYCCVPLRICFIRTSPKRLSIEVITCFSLTHCGRVTQICVFTLQLRRTGDADLRF